MAEKLGRNEHCWCGSKRKYKHCHLNRASQEPLPDWKTDRELREAFSYRLCLHPESGRESCEGPIVRAHTVRRAADLHPIAEAGHVYASNCAPPETGQTVPVLPSVGIGQASTFSGFCRKHDREFFAPLEARSFDGTQEQLHRLFYRAMAHELYKKQAMKGLIPATRERDRGVSPLQQREHQKYINSVELGVDLAIRDFKHYKQLCDAELASQSYDGMRGLMIHFDRVPDIVCAGITQATHSFSGKKLWDMGNVNDYSPAVGFSILVNEKETGAAVFTWRKESCAAAEELVASLLAMDRERIPDAVVRFAFEMFENTYLRKSWWNGLSSKVQAILLARMSHTFMQGDPSLTDDGVEVVNWSVTRIVEVGDSDLTQL